MVSNGDKWVRIFDVPENSKHKKGFTIYKVISMLYPESCPDAITKITVWKRYNDFKKLHREMKLLHKTLKLKDKIPSLPSSPFFKRFDSDVIQERRQGVLNFLEYIGGHPQLFTSNEFVKFFQTSHTPSEMLKSSINTIRAELSLPTEPEYFPFHSPNSDDEHTISDTDSISTLSSLTPSLQTTDLLADPLYKSTSSLTRLSKRFSSESSFANSQGLKVASNDAHDSLTISTVTTISADSMLATEKNIFPTPPTTPNYLTPTSPSQYILDAARHINLATQYETEKKYEQAFAEYKFGIDILLKNVKGDKNIDRKEMVRFKTEKYLLRAEKIYNLHLSNEIKSIQQYASSCEKTKMDYKPLSELYKYKVIKVIASGMLVLHSEFQKLYYVKVIQKTTVFSNDNLILPDHVPYMVKLHNFYNCENALFLVLQYCSGTKLLDYIKQRTSTTDNFDNGEVFTTNRLSIPETSKKDSDNESECSYTDLVNDYAYIKNTMEQDKSNSDGDQEVASSVDSSDKERKDSEDAPEVEISLEEEEGIHVEEVNNLEVNKLLEKSQKLLSSIDITLQKNYEKKVAKQRKKLVQTVVVGKDLGDKVKISSQRKSSDKSACDDLDEFEECPLVPVKYVVKWAAQIVLALEKLHSLGVICCDLKINNLLIDEDGDIVLTYMCKTTERTNIHSLKSDLCLAPELYTFNKNTGAADWWSLGIILYELLVGIPFKSIHPEELNNHTLIKIPKTVCAEGRSLLKQLLAFNPAHRLGYGLNGTEDLKSHPFFSAVSWDSLFSKYLL